MATSGYVLAAFCQTDSVISERERLYFPEIVHSLIYQLAEQHPSGLQYRREEIREALESSRWQQKDLLTAYKDVTETFSKLLADLEKSKAITIIIDRLDQCRWDKNAESEVGTFDAAVSSLMDITDDSALRQLIIKILLVMDSAPARKVWKRFNWMNSNVCTGKRTGTKTLTKTVTSKQVSGMAGPGTWEFCGIIASL
jgi:hypothetical protein